MDGHKLDQEAKETASAAASDAQKLKLNQKPKSEFDSFIKDEKNNEKSENEADSKAFASLDDVVVDSSVHIAASTNISNASKASIETNKFVEMASASAVAASSAIEKIVSIAKLVDSYTTQASEQNDELNKIAVYYQDDNVFNKAKTTVKGLMSMMSSIKDDTDHEHLMASIAYNTASFASSAASNENEDASSNMESTKRFASLSIKEPHESFSHNASAASCAENVAVEATMASSAASLCDSANQSTQSAGSHLLTLQQSADVIGAQIASIVKAARGDRKTDSYGNAAVNAASAADQNNTDAIEAIESIYTASASIDNHIKSTKEMVGTAESNANLVDSYNENAKSIADGYKYNEVISSVLSDANSAHSTAMVAVNRVSVANSQAILNAKEAIKHNDFVDAAQETISSAALVASSIASLASHAAAHANTDEASSGAVKVMSAQQITDSVQSQVSSIEEEVTSHADAIRIATSIASSANELTSSAAEIASSAQIAISDEVVAIKSTAVSNAELTQSIASQTADQVTNISSAVDITKSYADDVSVAASQTQMDEAITILTASQAVQSANAFNKIATRFPDNSTITEAKSIVDSLKALAKSGAKVTLSAASVADSTNHEASTLLSKAKEISETVVGQVSSASSAALEASDAAQNGDNEIAASAVSVASSAQNVASLAGEDVDDKQAQVSAAKDNNVSLNSAASSAAKTAKSINDQLNSISSNVDSAVKIETDSSTSRASAITSIATDNADDCKTSADAASSEFSYISNANQQAQSICDEITSNESQANMIKADFDDDELNTSYNDVLSSANDFASEAASSISSAFVAISDGYNELSSNAIVTSSAVQKVITNEQNLESAHEAGDDEVHNSIASSAMIEIKSNSKIIMDLTVDIESIAAQVSSANSLVKVESMKADSVLNVAGKEVEKLTSAASSASAARIERAISSTNSTASASASTAASNALNAANDVNSAIETRVDVDAILADMESFATATESAEAATSSAASKYPEDSTLLNAYYVIHSASALAGSASFEINKNYTIASQHQEMASSAASVANSFAELVSSNAAIVSSANEERNDDVVKSTIDDIRSANDSVNSLVSDVASATGITVSANVKINNMANNVSIACSMAQSAVPVVESRAEADRPVKSLDLSISSASAMHSEINAAASSTAASARVANSYAQFTVSANKVILNELDKVVANMSTIKIVVPKYPSSTNTKLESVANDYFNKYTEALATTTSVTDGSVSMASIVSSAALITEDTAAKANDLFSVINSNFSAATSAYSEHDDSLGDVHSASAKSAMTELAKANIREISKSTEASTAFQEVSQVASVVNMSISNASLAASFIAETTDRLSYPKNEKLSQAASSAERSSSSLANSSSSQLTSHVAKSSDSISISSSTSSVGLSQEAVSSSAEQQSASTIRKNEVFEPHSAALTSQEDKKSVSSSPTKPTFPMYMYATKGVYVYFTPNLTDTSRTHFYEPTELSKAKVFKVVGIETNKFGFEVYKLDDGNYTPVNDGGFKNLYYQISDNVNLVQVTKLFGIMTYKTDQFVERGKWIPKGKVLRVEKTLKHNDATCFLLSDGGYITSNKKYVNKI